MCLLYAGYIRDPKRIEDAPELLQGLNQNDALTLDPEDDYMALEGSPGNTSKLSPVLLSPFLKIIIFCHSCRIFCSPD